MYCRRSHLDNEGKDCALCDCSLWLQPLLWESRVMKAAEFWLSRLCWCGPASVTLTSHESSNSVRLGSSVATTAQERNSHQLPGSFTITATPQKQHLQLMHIVIFHHYWQPLLLEETSQAWLQLSNIIFHLVVVDTWKINQLFHHTTVTPHSKVMGLNGSVIILFS